MIDWTEGYVADLRAVRVDASTWTDSEIVGGVASVSIERDGDGNEPLLESGGMTVDTEDGRFESGWYRVELLATQGGYFERVPLVTLWMEPNSTRADKGYREVTCSGYSVLRPAATRHMRKGAYAPRGTNAVEVARQYLHECLDAPVEAVGEFSLQNDLVFNIGASYLSAAWTLLRAGGYCIRVAGDGTVRLEPMPTEPVVEITGKAKALFLPGFTEDRPLDDIPNAYHAIDGEETASAYNDDPNSPTSRVNRYVIDVVDGSPQVLSTESLQMYAERKLAEAREVVKTYGYVREFDPRIGIYDVIRAPLAETMAQADMRVMSQSLTAGNGVTVSETSHVLEVV